jgi:hypothetical protein
MFDYGATCAARATYAAASSSAAGAAADNSAHSTLMSLEARTGMSSPHESTLAEIIARIKLMRSKMIGHRWMTVLPQLMSRVCHKHKAVQSFLTSTLSAITNAFPAQTLWQLVGLSKSQVPLRSQRALAVLKPFRASSAANAQLVGVTEALVDELIRVAGEVPENDKTYALKSLSENTMFRNPGLVLPLLSSLTVVLAPKTAALTSFNDGFSKNPPMIYKFERHVDVMSRSGPVAVLFFLYRRLYGRLPHSHFIVSVFLLLRCISVRKSQRKLLLKPRTGSGACAYQYAVSIPV